MRINVFTHCGRVGSEVRVARDAAVQRLIVPSGWLEDRPALSFSFSENMPISE
jgi:hypothetical protein